MSIIGDRPAGAGALSPGIRRLVYVLGLPLVDGVFLMLVITGVLDTAVGILLVGIVVFGGSGVVTVILVDLSDDPNRNILGVIGVGCFVVLVAGFQAALAPMLASLLDVALLTWFASCVLVLLGIEIGGYWKHRRLPSVGLVILIGVIVSIRPGDVVWNPTLNIDLAIAGSLAAVVGVLLAIGVLYLGSWVGQRMNRGRFRIGGALSLAMLGGALVTPLPEVISLLVLFTALLVSFNVDGVDTVEFDVEVPSPGDDRYQEFMG